MKRNNGYIFIEVLIAASIMMMLLYTIVPLTSLLQYEREVLSERRIISSQLHDEMQSIISDDDNEFPESYTKSVLSTTVTFEFDRYEENTIKGCAIWENSKDKKEEFCLYGSLQK